MDSGNDRRLFLKLAGYGTLGLMTGGVWPILGHTAAAQVTAENQETGFEPDLDISLVSKAGELPIFPGAATQIWQYHAKVISGDKSRVVNLPGSYLGPIIKAHQGEKIRIRFTNAIAENIKHTIIMRAAG